MRVHVGVPRRELDRLLRRLEVGADAHHPLDARVARPLHLRVGVVGVKRASADLELEVTVRVDPRGHVSLHVSFRGNSGSPFSSVEPAGSSPHARRVGQALVLGAAGQAEAAPQLGRRVRDHRRREQRDDAQRLEAVAEHLRDRVGVARLVAAPTARGPR